MANKKGPAAKKRKRKIFAGRYAYSKPLGRGAGGAVYLAEDLQADRRLVALKVLSAEACATVQGKMLRREFEILSKLDHANLVRVYDYGSLPDGGVFLAEEYIDGFSLQDARALLEPEALIDVTLQLLQGLSYLHGMGMIHRDVKPANVMLLWLDDAKARPMVKLVDFGLSSMDPKKDTLRGGTRSYMAPEIIRGEKGEFRSDLYSLGVTLYYAMCGVLPFGPRSKSDPPPTEEDFRPPEPHRLNPDVPLSLSRFTMVLLRQLEDVEYADAGEALQALASDSDSLEWIAGGTLANNLDIAAPPVLRGYFERGILIRQDDQRDDIVDELTEERTTGRLSNVRGADGVGKSRLLHEVESAMKLSRRVVVTTDGDEEMSAFGLVLDVLRQFVELADSRDLELGEQLRPNVNILSRLAPWVAQAKTQEERASDYAWIREAFSDLVVMLHPEKIVIFVEDLHLADEDSVRFFERWFDEPAAPNRPDMVVSTAPGHVTDSLSMRNDVDVYEIEGLRAEDVAYFFRERLGEDDIPDDWIASVAMSSRGNPAYLDELSRHLIDAGILGRRSSISWFVDRDQLLDFSLPSGLKESLRRRLMALGTLGREALELMSLLDRPVEWAVLRKLLADGGEDPESAERTIELLLWRHFIRQDLDQRGRFVRLIEPELGEVVREQMNPEWRRSLHRRIGERLRKRWNVGGVDAGEAAKHLARGGKDEEACHFFEIAADAALRESRFLQAAEALEEGQTLRQHGPSGVLLRVKLAEAWLKNCETDRALDMLDQAWNSAERTALEWLMYRTSSAGVSAMISLGRPDGAREWLDRLRDYLPVLTRQPQVTLMEARLQSMRGEVDEAIKRLREAMAKFDHFGNRVGYLEAEVLRARLEFITGDADAADDLFADAIEQAHVDGYQDVLGRALCGRGAMSRALGRHEQAHTMLNEAFEVVSVHGSVDVWIETLLEIGESHLAAGELEAARQRAREAERLAGDLGHALWGARARLIIGETHVHDGDLAEGLRLVEGGLADITASSFSFPYGPSALHRYGRLLEVAGRTDEAEQYLEQARKVAGQLGIAEGRNVA